MANVNQNTLVNQTRSDTMEKKCLLNKENIQEKKFQL
jgi:hypothetical protein